MSLNYCREGQFWGKGQQLPACKRCLTVVLPDSGMQLRAKSETFQILRRGESALGGCSGSTAFETRE